MKRTCLVLMGWVLFVGAGCGTWRGVPPGASRGTEVEVLAKATRSWDHALLPAYPEGQPEVSILRITIPPGISLSMHRHPVINAGVMLRGGLTVTKEDGQVLHLREGEAIIEVVGSWHYGKNEGPGPAEIIVFYAGIEGMPVTENKPVADSVE